MIWMVGYEVRHVRGKTELVFPEGHKLVYEMCCAPEGIDSLLWVEVGTNEKQTRVRGWVILNNHPVDDNPDELVIRDYERVKNL